MRINYNKLFTDLLAQYCKLTNQHCTKKAAIEAGATHFLQLDNTPGYGGWRLNAVKLGSGAHDRISYHYSSVHPRFKPTEMHAFLIGLLVAADKNLLND
jgi:hypothetical protein